MLCKPLIIRVFAPEGDFVRKYALIFRGISENRGGKIGKRLQSVSASYSMYSGLRKRQLSGTEAAVFH